MSVVVERQARERAKVDERYTWNLTDVFLDVTAWRDACEGLPLAHMGRGPDEDPWFFAAAYAAGRLATR